MVDQEQFFRTVRRVRGRAISHVRRAGIAIGGIGPGRIVAQVTSMETTAQRLVVRGWALMTDSGSEVIVSCNVAASVIAVAGEPVPVGQDGRALATRPGATGWVAEIPLPPLTMGEISVGVAVASGDLVDHGLGAVTTLRTDSLLGAMDLPRADDEVVGPIHVVGWALVSRGVDRVELTVDGAEAGFGRLLASVRPDIATVVDEADAAICGWEGWAQPPAGASAGDVVTVAAHAVVLGQRVLLGSADVRLVEPGFQVADESRALQLHARSSLVGARNQPGAAGTHVLVVTHDLGFGGGQLYLQTLLLELLHHDDLTVTVLAPTDGALRKELEEAGACVEIVGHPPTTAVEYESWMQGVVARALPGGCSSVIANTLGCFWGISLADRLGVPSLWAVHESFAFDHFTQVGFRAPADAWVIAEMRSAFAKAGRVVFEADSTGQLFDDLIPQGRRVRVDYGIDLAEIASFLESADRRQIRDEFDLPPEASVLLSMGTFEPRKAQPLLITAFARVAESYPDAVLVAVGDAPGGFSDAIHDLVRRLGLGNRVRLVPVTPRVREWYYAADGFILASDVESLSRAMLEAIAIGTPIVVSDVFGHPEVIGDGIHGFLFEPSSVSSVQAALERFLSTGPDERVLIARRAREDILAGRDEATFGRTIRRLLGEATLERAQ